MPGDRERFRKKSPMPVPVDELLAWHARHGAFERLMPPWETLSVARRALGDQSASASLPRLGPIGNGAVLEMRLHKGPLRLPWVADHHSFLDDTINAREVSSPHGGMGRFKDTQAKGPFAAWDHEHKFLPSPVWPTHSELEDDVYYKVPMGTLGDALGGGLVGAMLEKMFAFRHARTRADLARHWRHHDKPRQRVLVAGASGMIGSQLVPYLMGAGHEVVRLVRRPERRGLENGGGRAIDGAFERRWDPGAGRLDEDVFDGVTAVINLAGHNVASGRYTDATKRLIERSRVDSTALLAGTMAGLDRKPGVFINASATGYYGHHPVGAGELDEGSAGGEGFLAGVCRSWEAAAGPASEAGIRTVLARIGIVLSPRGGALRAQLPLFGVGLGGALGSGAQVWPWVGLDDVLGAIEFLMHTGGVSGPVNVCAPAPVSNAAFASVLGKVLGRPAAIRVPEEVIEKVFGEMGRETALKSTPAVPARLQEAGFGFLTPTLEDALRWELWKPEKGWDVSVGHA